MHLRLLWRHGWVICSYNNSKIFRPLHFPKQYEKKIKTPVNKAPSHFSYQQLHLCHIKHWSNPHRLLPAWTLIHHITKTHPGKDRAGCTPHNFNHLHPITNNLQGPAVSHFSLFFFPQVIITLCIWSTSRQHTMAWNNSWSWLTGKINILKKLYESTCLCWILTVCKPVSLRTTFYEDKSKYNAGKKPTQLVSVQMISYVSDLAVI